MNDLQSRRSVFFQLRSALCFVVLALLLFQRHQVSPVLWLVGTAYLVSALVLPFLPASWFRNAGAGYAVFFLDIVGLTVILYSIAGLGSDSLLLFYLTVFMATLGGDVAKSIGVAFGASALFIWLRLSQGSSILGDSASLMRIPLFMVTALLCGYLAQEVRRQRRQIRGLKDLQESLTAQIGSSARDLARSEELRDAAQELARRFDNLLQDLGAVVWEMEVPAFKITFVSRQAERILGYPVQKWLGETDFWAKHIHETDREQVVALCQKSLSEGRDHVLEYRALAADGRVVWLQDVVRVVRDDSGKVLQLRGVMVDITERKVLEEEFRQAQKMEAVGRLAGGVAHDFNNMLTVIDGYSQLALGRLAPGDTLHDYIQEIQSASKRAGAMTRRLLAFSRRQVLQPQVVDLNVLASDTEKMLRRLIGEDIELVVVRQEGLGAVRCDPAQIEQVLANLAVNARDAMPQGGKLIIETANAELDEDYARTHAGVKAGPYAMLAVTDTGCGMDQETQLHIFEPFFTTKEKGKGTGLGLATVYGIVKQSGGSIWVYSELGRGTTFKIFLPRTVELAQKPKAVVAPSPPLRGMETILLVEDEDPVRSMVRGILESNGYSILEADHPDAALITSQRYEGHIHLMITDVVMPRMSGPELAARLKPFRPDTKILYMSGYSDAAILHHGILEPSETFLQKPFTPNALARKVREVLG
ncbi:MAG: ATP-binding protein [Terriglobia bacterium]